MWCETVGWDLPMGSTRSQAQTSPSPAAAHHREQAQPGRIGQDLEHAGQQLGVGLVEGAVAERGAAGEGGWFGASSGSWSSGGVIGPGRLPDE